MRRYRLDRRQLLQTLTIGAGSLVFAAPWRAKGQGDPGPPKRIIIFPIANGVSDYPDMVADGATTHSFTCGPMLQPLADADLLGDTVIVDNIEYLRPVDSVDTHFCGIIQMLCGTYSPSYMDGVSASISLDRYLGQTIGASSPWSQLLMGTMCDSVTYSYKSDGTAVPAVTDPRVVYSNVFASLTGGAPSSDVLRRLLRRQSVLDTVSSDIASFRTRLSSEDRDRADAQLDAIRTMEKRVASALQGTPSCNAPTIDQNIDYSLCDYVPETLRAFTDLAVAALACDQTRVVLMHSYLREYHPPNFMCPWDPVDKPDDNYHGLSHDSAGDNYGSFRKARAFHFQIAAELANKLKAIPENGGSMLDNTLIYLPTEIGRGHTNSGLQVVTIGGKGLGVNVGQYMFVGSQRDIGLGVAHQRLLVSLLNALGLTDETFGEGDGTGSGPLSGFLT